MLYEPWVETAKDYHELSQRLKGRGYSNIPMGAIPMLDLKSYSVAPIANTSNCNVVKTMLRKQTPLQF